MNLGKPMREEPMAVPEEEVLPMEEEPDDDGEAPVPVPIPEDPDLVPA